MTTVAFSCATVAWPQDLSVKAKLSILATLLWRGLGGLSLTVFTTSTLPPGSGGGLLNELLWLGVLISFLMSVGALMPIPNLDGATILYWSRH